MQEGTSTIFHVTRIIDEAKISIVTDVYPQDHLVYISAHPWTVFNESDLDELKIFEQKWNKIGMFSTLTIEEERGVIEPDKYCFHLTGRIITDKNGLGTQLWGKYIENLIKETLDAWAECDKIVDPTIFEFMNSLVKEDETDASFKAFRFNQ
ncbi:MAG: hypothetical protein K2H32_02090 [Muribaculaceae bacterium]|nr:hypothetical protein [Muribaculaceae bacterium]MDE7368271.1 hypothetical protein [Muribaculaceae bacterium]